MADQPYIPPLPNFLMDKNLWARAANNILERAEGLLRDELAWRRAHPCMMAEYFRLGLLEDKRALNPWRRNRYSKWSRMCKAARFEKDLCPYHVDEEG